MNGNAVETKSSKSDILGCWSILFIVGISTLTGVAFFIGDKIHEAITPKPPSYQSTSYSGQMTFEGKTYNVNIDTTRESSVYTHERIEVRPEGRPDTGVLSEFFGEDKHTIICIDSFPSDESGSYRVVREVDGKDRWTEPNYCMATIEDHRPVDEYITARRIIHAATLEVMRGKNIVHQETTP